MPDDLVNSLTLHCMTSDRLNQLWMLFSEHVAKDPRCCLLPQAPVLLAAMLGLGILPEFARAVVLANSHDVVFALTPATDQNHHAISTEHQYAVKVLDDPDKFELEASAVAQIRPSHVLQTVTIDCLPSEHEQKPPSQVAGEAVTVNLLTADTHLLPKRSLKWKSTFTNLPWWDKIGFLTWRGGQGGIILQKIGEPVLSLTPSNVMLAWDSLCGCLDYIHSKQMAHCDVRLPNVLLLEGSHTLIDFGSSKELTEELRVADFRSLGRMFVSQWARSQDVEIRSSSK